MEKKHINFASSNVEIMNYPDTYSKEEQLEMVKKSKLDVSEVELGTPPLFHAVAGAWYAENVLNIHDDDMLNAVRYHTVGRVGMSKLEKIIYLGKK